MVGHLSSDRRRSRTTTWSSSARTRATFRRHDDEISTQLDVAVSTEDDVEVRRVTVVNQSTRIREIDVTSYAEIVLAAPADDLAHPAFGKLFLETEYLADSAALLCHRRARDPRDPAVWAVHVLSLEGRPQGPVEWETDRARFLGRGRDTDSPAALDGRALSGTTGIVLDPDLQPPPADQAGPGRVGAPLFRHGHRVGSRDGRSARPEVPRPERGLAHLRARLHARAERSAPSGHFERRGAAVRASGVEGALRRRLAAGGSGHDCVERARPGRSVAARHFRRSAHPARARRRRRRCGARASGPSGAGVLAPERAERRRRHPERGSIQLSGRDARAAHGPARQRAVADVETPIRRRVPPARRSDRQSGAHVDRGRRAGGPRRRPGRPPRPARQTASGPEQPASGVRGRCRRRSRPSRRSSTRRSRRRR